MWINFEAYRPFAIRIYVGGINAISGESQLETVDTFERRKQKLINSESIQDYVVTPFQSWLDGIAKADGKVMQFVATSKGSGYSVEAQLTGTDRIGGIQFEIIPARLPSRSMTLWVKTLTGKQVSLCVSPEHTIDEVKYLIHGRAGISPGDQRLIFAGKQLDDCK